jgi:putative proteasome-type protease
MTFCLGMKCREGLLAIADTRITSGTETSLAKKITVYQGLGSAHSMFILTSGLRSVRDKAITYFQERLADEGAGVDRMYKAANILSEEIRRVRAEDEKWLVEGGLQFDLHCIFGGQLEADDEHRLYLIYPEGNWVEVSAGTPYVIIGDSRYGKPLLDRAWNYDSTLPQALRDGLLAFDATRTSASDVDYPIDVVLYRTDSFQMREQRYTREDLQPVQEFWQAAVMRAAEEADTFVAPLFKALDHAVTVGSEA